METGEQIYYKHPFRNANNTVGIVIAKDSDRQYRTEAYITTGTGWESRKDRWGHYYANNYYWAIPYNDGKIDMETWTKFILEIFNMIEFDKKELIYYLEDNFSWEIPDPLFETIK